GGVTGLAFDPAGRLATAGADRQVRVWDSGTGRGAHTLTGATERVNDLRVGPGGRVLAGAGGGGGVGGRGRGGGGGGPGAAPGPPRRSRASGLTRPARPWPPGVATGR